MQYRKLRANAIFNGTEMLKGRVLVMEENGTVAGLVNDDGDAETVYHNGVLVPGFINSHCHLELSHMRNVIPPGTGLIPFLISVVRQRGSIDQSTKPQQIQEAAEEMYRNGIVAVADICNTTDALAVKKESNMQWHNLVEVLNFFDENLQNALQSFGAVADAHLAAGLQAVLTPHAPYSVSISTLEEINRRTAGQVISVHNQETPAEDALFRKGEGAFLQLYEAFLQGRNPVAPTGKSSLQSWLPYFTNGQTLVLVHNSFITEPDILFAKEHAARRGLNIIYCICPNANLYIEAVLPPLDLLMKHGVQVVIGTDSYSSNWQLSIAAEIKTLRDRFPHIPLSTLLQWATSSAAAAFGFARLGSFEKGKKPGVLLLQEQDLSVQRII